MICICGNIMNKIMNYHWCKECGASTNEKGIIIPFGTYPENSFDKWKRVLELSDDEDEIAEDK